jgi:ATP-dependent DNA helicase RecG
MNGEMSRAHILEALGLKDRKHFGNEFLQLSLDEGIIEMTVPDKPQSSKQRYRLMPKGRKLLRES